MKRFVVAVFLEGCAVKPIPLSDLALERFQLPVKHLAIDDYSSEAGVGVTDVVYQSGWVSIRTGFEPTLNEAFVSKLKIQ